jgi:hypothetical protein
VLAYTIAAERGDIGRFASPRKLAGDSDPARASTSPVSATCAARSASRDRATCARRAHHDDDSRPDQQPSPVDRCSGGSMS